MLPAPRIALDDKHPHYGRAPGPPSRSAEALPQRRNREARADLGDGFHVADIDAEFQSRRRDRCRRAGIVTEPEFDVLAFGLGQAAVMGEELVRDPVLLAHQTQAIRI